MIVSAALTLFDEAAVIVAIVWLFTALVVTVNWPLFDPSGMTMLPGTLAEPLLLERFTSTPPAPA